MALLKHRMGPTLQLLVEDPVVVWEPERRLLRITGAEVVADTKKEFVLELPYFEHTMPFIEEGHFNTTEVSFWVVWSNFRESIAKVLKCNNGQRLPSLIGNHSVFDCLSLYTLNV